MKKGFILFFIIFSFSKLFSELNVFVDINRFIDRQGNTRYEVSYQIPYNQIEFQRVKNGYRAILKIDFSLKKNDKVVYSKPLLRQLIETNDVINSPKYSYQDKIHFSLSKSGFELNLKFIDLVKQDSLIYSKRLVNFRNGINLISDLELDYLVEKDTTKYKEKFHRGNILYLGNQNHIFNNSKYDTLFVYYELYKNNYFDGGLINLSIVKNDSIVFEKSLETGKLLKDITPFLNKVDIHNLKKGYYEIFLKILDNEKKFLAEKKNYFIIRHPRILKLMVFYNLDNDRKLVEYFLNSHQKKILRSLKKKDAIENFISKFWISHDINPATENNEFLELVKSRIRYSNQNFSYFKKGWLTDRGRIYIKYGEPDFKKKYKTSSSAKYPFKNYEVWQYRTNRDQTYIFFDMQGNNSYRLIYSGNDPTENSYPNWRDFLGEEFEQNDLE